MGDDTAGARGDTAGRDDETPDVLPAVKVVEA